MSLIGEWVRDIFIVILSITFIEILMPEGNMAKYLKFIFSIIVLAVILSPVSYFYHK
ncbi:stage III sporulation protein AF [Ihubacter sp. rT4E-8]|uniref:stage III sporulation protein AF n=1 Tax=unclassified Ihubacter TaxID=2633299 RepID=UPI00137A4C8C